MFGNGSTLPVWVFVLVGGVFLNFILGLVNPFVPNEYRREAKEFRKNGFRQRAPLVMAHARFGENVYAIIVVVIILAFSILFFIESYKGIVESLTGGFMGSCLAFSIYLVALALESALMISAATFGERIKAEWLTILYRKRYIIMLIFNESEFFGDWIYHDKRPRAENLKDIMVKDDDD